MQIRKINLTPELAKEFRANQVTRQRTLSKAHVAFLGQLLIDDEFDPDNGETLKFDIKGRMFDGNHRCAAVEQTGIPTPIWVTEGWPETAFLTVDQARPRTLGQLLQIKGEKNPNDLSTSIRYAYTFSRKRPIRVHKERLSSVKALRWLERHGGIRKMPVRFRKSILVPQGLLGGIYYITVKRDRKWAERMFLPLLNLDMSCDHGPKLLRQRLIKNLKASRRNRVDRYTQMAWLIKLWNWGNEFDPRLKASDYGASLEY